MTEPQLHTTLLLVMLALAVITFVALQFVTAPYGKFTRRGWGPTVNRTAGWVIMESPSVWTFALCFALGGRTTDDALPWVFLSLWMLHYVNRSFVFPFRLRGGAQNMTLLAAGLAFVFTAANGYLNARWLYTLGPGYPPGWWTDPRFLGGVALFLGGFAINQHADHVLINLRQPGETGYKIPRGGLFEYVSAANYFGELIEWTGWALLTWSLPGLVFVLWTAANLVPRALAQHRWYREKFPDYPTKRKAVIPFVL